MKEIITLSLLQERKMKIYLTLGVVALGPVVASSALPKHEVVRSEDLTERAGPHAVHGAGLEVHQHRPRHVLAAARFVVVDIDPLQLLVQVSLVASLRPDAVLVAGDTSALYLNGNNTVLQTVVQVLT